MVGIPAEVEFAVKENEGEDMKFVDVEMLKERTKAGATLSENSNFEGAAELKASLRNLRRRRILNECQTITGESLNQSTRDKKIFKATEQ